MTEVRNLLVVPRQALVEGGNTSKVVFLAALVEALVEEGRVYRSGDYSRRVLPLTPQVFASAFPWIGSSQRAKYLHDLELEGVIVRHATGRVGSEKGGRGHTMVSLHEDTLRERYNALWDVWSERLGRAGDV